MFQSLDVIELDVLLDQIPNIVLQGLFEELDDYLGADPDGSGLGTTELDSEYTAVARHLSDASGEVNARGTLFRTDTLIGSHRTRRVALAQVGPGNVGAGVHVERALTTFDPEVILFVGVAGGLKEDVRLGDVVVTDAIYDYETGKDDEEDFRPRAKTAAPSNDAVQRARNVVTDDGWQRRSLAAPLADAPRAFVKPVAAGNKVVASRGALTAERLRQSPGGGPQRVRPSVQRRTRYFRFSTGVGLHAHGVDERRVGDKDDDLRCYSDVQTPPNFQVFWVVTGRR